MIRDFDLNQIYNDFDLLYTFKNENRYFWTPGILLKNSM